ncbi:sensor domain-containing protein [Shewanella aestuarii]|uniref:Sensor protein FixL n=1 Tax=Shewanella aestuarii TaxID=1028752 RepID=A0A6G9QMC3_9GAMM|nr:GGDEF domain-containing phosphodiesterase [Shewanella aestuarii]QIR14999.1 EAL domain-containing protein [Shewanella aestuarii]
MFKYKKLFNETSFRYIVKSQEKMLITELQNLNKELNADILFLGVRDGSKASTIIALNEQDIIDNFTYNLSGSPCEKVLNEGVCCFPEGTAKLFPNDKALLDLKVEGYIGSSIKNENDESIGILVALYFESDTFLAKKINLFETFSKFLCSHIQKCHLEYQTNSHLSLFNEVEVISKTGAWEYHIETMSYFFSSQIYEIYGIQVNSELSVKSAISYFAEHEHSKIEQIFKNVLNYGTSFEEVFEFVDSKSVKKWVKITGKPSVNNNGQIDSIYGAFEDITTEKEMLIKESERSERLENILNNINEAVITICSKGVIKHVNKSVLSMFKYSANELLGQNIAMLMPEPHASNHQHYLESYQTTGVAKIINIGRQLSAKRKDGDIFQMELAITQTTSLGEVQYIGVIRDISERIKSQDTIYNIAFTDNLTQLKNNKWFEKECKDLLNQASIEKKHIHVIMLNIDKMSQLNLQFGFEFGDLVLKEVAANLKLAIGNDCSIYRYNGAAFLILLKKSFIKNESTKMRINLLHTTLLDPKHYKLKVNGKSVVVSASLGAANINVTNQSYEAIIQILEHTVSKAKKLAPMGLCHILEDDIEEFDRFVQLHKILKNITESDELSLVFQPQFTNKGELNSFEALIRWQSEIYGQVSPAEFIPLAEETDAIIKIGDWVLLNVCKAIQELLHLGLRKSISVNISAKQIVEYNFSEKLIDLITLMKIPAEMLVLELTETALIVDISLVKQAMDVLSKHGFRFSIDDFGTGYSSLAYLKELPISELKIDKYFIDDIDSDDTDKQYVIVDAIIYMANALGVRSIAEGVETQKQLKYLERKNCNIYQGYYFSKPLNMSSWREMIRVESKR